MAIEQLKYTNDNIKNRKNKEQKMIDVSKKDRRGFGRATRIMPIEVRNEQAYNFILIPAVNDYRLD